LHLILLIPLKWKNVAARDSKALHGLAKLARCTVKLPV
jgi:hypothetical protein